MTFNEWWDSGGFRLMEGFDTKEVAEKAFNIGFDEGQDAGYEHGYDDCRFNLDTSWLD